MLKAIQIKNFKSYREARLPLAPLTVLIGANASGKSNAIEAMRFLSWLAQGQKLSSIRYAVDNGDQLVRGQIEDLGFRRGESFQLHCETDIPRYNHLSIGIVRRMGELHIEHEALEAEGRDIPLYRIDQPSTGQGSDVGVQYDNFTKGGKKPRITCIDQAAIFTQLTSPASFSINHKASQRDIPKITRQYESSLAKMLFLDPVPAKMRDYSFPSERQLRGDGKNLSGVLYNLCSTETDGTDLFGPGNGQQILQFIQSLPEQDITSVDFLKGPRGEVMIQLTETFGGEKRTYDASLLSDGTLRVLAIAAAMLTADEGSLVVIEEIDNGVHPSRARHLLEQIQAIAQRRNLRVLLSTHNPAMLDALPDPAIPHVVFCYRDPADGSSRLVRLEDVADYPELIAQGTLGSLVTTGTLERFVKQARQPEERKAKALAWLDSIRTVADE